MQIFDFKPTEHGVVLGAPPKTFIVSETNKAGVTVGYYLITAWLPTGSAGIITAGSGYSFEVSISKDFFEVAEQSGQFTVRKFVQQPDPQIQQYQGEWDAVQYQLRAVDAKLGTLVMGSGPWQQVFFSEKMPLMNKAYQIELTAAAAGTPIQKQGK